MSEYSRSMQSIFKNKKRNALRFIDKVIGKLVDSEPGVEYAMLYIKPLEAVSDREL